MPGLTPQQHEAVVSVDKNVIVSAGAGSGKTHVLVERYIELLRSRPDLTVDCVVAVTFTRKAAGEMRTRLKTRFKTLSLEDPENAERWRKCLADIDSARIGTIHSLCESILKAFPVESGIDPQFEVLNEVDQAELLDESITEAFRLIIAEQHREVALLFDFNIDDVRRWLGSMIIAGLQFKEAAARMVELSDRELIDYMNEVRHRLQIELMAQLVSGPRWREAVDALVELAWTDRLEEQRLEVLAMASAASGVVDAGRQSASPADSAAAWRQLQSLCEIGLRIGGNKEGAKEIKAHMKVLRDRARGLVKEMPAEILEDDLEAFSYCRMLAALFYKVESIYAFKKQEALKLDYNDLIEVAHRVLTREDSPAREHYRDRLHAILIDEFQDTNSIQAALVSSLAGRSTRLFFIGDDKQSIYKFQGADVSTFNSWRSFLSGEEDSARNSTRSVFGEKLSQKLNISFRSHPAIVDFVNVVFSRLMPDTDIEYGARFEALQASRQPAASSDKSEDNIDVVFFETIDEDDRRDSREAAILEGLAVADWIREKIASGAPILDAEGNPQRALSYADFAVLVPKNSDFLAIEQGLADRGIPFTTFAGRGFLSRQEILDLENLLYFLGNPLDSHSLLGVLRSPLFAISDDIIHELVTLAGKGDLFETLQTSDLRNRPGYQSLRKATASIRHMLEDSRRLPVSELVMSILERTNYELVLMGLPGGVQRARNLLKLVSIAREEENLTCLDFARRLTLMREYGIKQSDAPVGSSESVKLMTIHASKGLEFPAVALPCLGGMLRKPSPALIFHPAYGLALNTRRVDEDEVPAWHRYASRLDQEMEVAERRRLLYVAATRAREYLGLFIDRDSSDRESFRTWLLEALELDPARVIAVPEAEPERFCITGGIAESSFRVSLKTKESLSLAGVFEEAPAGADSETLDKTTLNPLLLDVLALNDREIKPDTSGLMRITPTGAELDEAPIIDPTVLGTYFHAIMENLPVSMDTPSLEFLQDLAFDSRLSGGFVVSHPVKLRALVEDGRELLSIYLQSDLRWVVLRARRKFHEIPYSLLNDGVLSSKRPDLLLQDFEGRWYVIDFKTDHVLTDAEVAAHVNRHRGQLGAYANDLYGLTGISFTPAIYFARLGKTVLLDGSQFASGKEGREPQEPRSSAESKTLDFTPAEPVQLKLEFN
ncbi:MAG: UvrD-helicase domain-containing protein [Candidatus Obscuribacterales bacterium]